VTAGIKANNDGSAAIQVGGTDYITISSAGAVAIPVSLTVGGIPAGGNYNLVAYTSPTTWDATTKKAAGLKAIKVTVVGGGGNTTGGSTPVPGLFYQGGGGGGGVAVEYVPVSNITPGTKTVTAGAGTNSFGPWGTATPNSPTATTTATAGADGATTTASPATVSGGAGGAGSGGTFTFAGQVGGGIVTNQTSPGAGGNSLLGWGCGGVPPSSNNAPGVNGIGYGAGGSGVTDSSSVLSQPRGVGTPGIVIIEEFY